MKVLIIIPSHVFHENCCENIKILNEYMKQHDVQVDYCGISGKDDFYMYETIIPFKYKVINTKKQFSKICDFITDYKSELDYDWYIKIRPEVKLLENISFDNLSKNAINARARVYHGPLKIKYGMSVGGEGCWKKLVECYYAETEHDVILDDMFFIFHKNLVQQNAFDKVDNILSDTQNEWDFTLIFEKRKIALNVIGIHFYLTKHGAFSGNINL